MVRRNKTKIEYPNSLDFSINYGPFRIPNFILKKFQITPQTISFYPHQHAKNIVLSLANFLKVKYENLIISNGSTEIFFLLPQILKFKRATIITPSFWEYETTLSLNKVKITFFKLLPRNNFLLSKKEFEKSIKKSDCIYICNPNNPTSTYINKTLLLNLIKKFKDKLFIIDETYLLFFKDYKSKTLNNEATKINNLIVVSSLSKIFSIGGIRIGFCIASKKNISFIKRFKNPYSLNIFAESILPYLIKNTKYVNKTREFISIEKIRVYEKIKKISWLKPFKPEANFILARIENKKISPRKLIKYLLEHNIKIRECSRFGGLSNKYIRLSIKTKRENNILINSLKTFHKLYRH